MTKWQPIETAPEVDDWFLVWAIPWDEHIESIEEDGYQPEYRRICVTRARIGGFADTGDRLVVDPTHWHPLPEPPTG